MIVVIFALFVLSLICGVISAILGAIITAATGEDAAETIFGIFQVLMFIAICIFLYRYCCTDWVPTFEWVPFWHGRTD